MTMITRIVPRDLQPATNRDSLNRVLGSGPRFPFQFSDKGDVKQIVLASGTEKVNESIWTILTTRKGERVGRPTFGSNLPKLVFEQNDEILWSQLEYETAEALKIWEPRIRIRRVAAVQAGEMSISDLAEEFNSKEYVQAFRDGSVIGIAIEYEVIRTAQTGVFVYPFVVQTASLSFGT